MTTWQKYDDSFFIKVHEYSHKPFSIEVGMRIKEMVILQSHNSSFARLAMSSSSIGWYLSSVPFPLLSEAGRDFIFTIGE